MIFIFNFKLILIILLLHWHISVSAAWKQWPHLETLRKENIKNNKVESIHNAGEIASELAPLPFYHFPMINDKQRNLAFHNALKQAIMMRRCGCYNTEYGTIMSDKSSDSNKKSAAIKCESKSFSGSGSNYMNLSILINNNGSLGFYGNNDAAIKIEYNENIDGSGVGHFEAAEKNLLHSKICATQNNDDKGVVVIDLGAGMGLLSLAAAELGADLVIGIERNGVLANIFRDLVEHNGFEDRIEVIEKESFYFNPEEDLMQFRNTNYVNNILTNEVNTNIYETPDILVAEVLDGWIIGEGFLSSLMDLKQREVISKHTKIIPSSAQLYMQLVESSFSLPENSKLVGNVDFEPVRKYKPVFDSVLKRFDIVSNLSDPINVFNFDFQNYEPNRFQQLNSFRSPYLDGLFDHVKLSVPIKNTGMLHGAVFWFDLDMNGDGLIKLSNAPFSNTHWGPMFWTFKYDVRVEENTILNLELARIAERYIVAVDDGKTAMRLVVVQSNCDADIEVFAGTFASSQKFKGESKFSFSQKNEYNILAAPIGFTVRAIIKNYAVGKSNRSGQVKHADYLITIFEDGRRDVRLFNVYC